MAGVEILDLEEGSGDSEAFKSLCLMGKVLPNKPVNLNGLTNIINTAWKTRNPVKALQDRMIVSELNFTRCPFWFQIHGLLVDKITQGNAEFIGKSFGKLLAIESSPKGILLNRSFLRVKVKIDTDVPLPKDFCYWCGRIGHDNKVCNHVSKVEGPNFGYDPHLRTGRAKRSDVLVVEFPQKQISEESREEVAVEQISINLRK
ncbi:hypothetical protein Vadar_006589 [Vaccinium darrowii]|uniref:Uncharacterized protein n=1 Tax=Vaccinium darrowii TaxID=229202 RepID=A0ACB7YUI8_9ERIC|nr:hypothetical protein Vadar_006589 [Vaccinium darrowii]